MFSPLTNLELLSIAASHRRLAWDWKREATRCRLWRFLCAGFSIAVGVALVAIDGPPPVALVPIFLVSVWGWLRLSTLARVGDSNAFQELELADRIEERVRADEASTL